MHCYVTLSNVFKLLHKKMHIHYSVIRRLASYKICLCFIVLSVTVCTVGYVCLFHSFLTTIIYEVLYMYIIMMLKYNICSAWFLDIRKNINLFHCEVQQQMAANINLHNVVLWLYG